MHTKDTNLTTLSSLDLFRDCNTLSILAFTHPTVESFERHAAHLTEIERRLQCIVQFETTAFYRFDPQQDAPDHYKADLANFQHTDLLSLWLTGLLDYTRQGKQMEFTQEVLLVNDELLHRLKEAGRLDAKRAPVDIPTFHLHYPPAEPDINTMDLRELVELYTTQREAARATKERMIEKLEEN